MAAFKTVEYTAQALAATNGAAMADGNKTSENLLIARCAYTLLGTEVATDTIGLVLLGPGAVPEPALSSAYSADPGTTLTGTVGTVADADAYSSAMTLDAGGQVRFTPTTPPVELIVPTLVNFTIGSAAALTAGVVLYFDIAYSTRH